MPATDFTPNPGTLFELILTKPDTSVRPEIRVLELAHLGDHALDVLIDMARRESNRAGTGLHNVSAWVDGIKMAEFRCLELITLPQPG